MFKGCIFNAQNTIIVLLMIELTTLFDQEAFSSYSVSVPSVTH